MSINIKENLLSRANGLLRSGSYQQALSLYQNYIKSNPEFYNYIKYNICLCEKKIKNNKPLVTVIVPVYNVEQYLEKCLDSILGQSLYNIEVVVVDDGSTDNSQKIIKKYVEKDARVISIINSHASGNSGSPRNQALEMVKGEYIAFVDSDDWIDSHMLEDLYRKAVLENADIALSKSFYRELNTGESIIVETTNNYFDLEKQPNRKKLFLNSHFPIVWHRVYKTEFVHSNFIRFGETKTSADLPFAFKSLITANKIVFVDKPYYHYRFDRPGSTIGKRKGPASFELFDSYKIIIDFLKRKGLYDEFISYVINKALGDYRYNLKFLNKEYHNEFNALMSIFVKEHWKVDENKDNIFSSNTLDSLNKLYFSKHKKQNLRLTNNNPKLSLSVIVPVYNSSEYIEKCLSSLLCQSIRNYEIIIVNDGSTDNSLVIIEQIIHNKSNIKLVNCSRASGSPGIARNLGIISAVGKYIGFVDSDDWIESCMYEKLCNKALEKDFDIVSAGAFFLETQKGLSEQKSISFPEINESTSNNLDLFKSNYLSNIWNRIYKRALIKDYGIYFPHIYLAEDFCFSIVAYSFAKNTTGLKQAFYHWRFNRPESTTDIRRREKGFLALDTLPKEIKYFSYFGLYEKYKAHILHKKQNSLFWNYNRLATEYKDLFLKRMRTILLSYAQDFDLRLFNENEKKRFLLLNLPCKNDFESVVNKICQECFQEIEIQRLDNLLWGGQFEYAKHQMLRYIDLKDYNINLRQKAARKLAIRLSFEGDVEGCDFLLKQASQFLPLNKQPKELFLTMFFFYFKMGRYVEAEQAICDIDKSSIDANVILAKSNLIHDDKQRLNLINTVFKKKGYATLKKNKPLDSLSLNNIDSYAPNPSVEDIGTVSVIMPVYCAEGYIEMALKSVCNQSYSNLEIIVVDDCSTDFTHLLVEDLAKQDKRIKFFRMSNNSGAYPARNYGLTQATGQFITTHDADDWSHPQKIEKQLSTLRHDPNLVGVVSYWARVTPDLRFTSGWRLGSTVIEFNHSSFLFKREVYDILGNWDPVRVGADTEYIWRVESYYGKSSIKRILPNLPLSFALDDENSLTRRKGTHVSSLYFGLRHYYREISRYYHAHLKNPGKKLAKNEILDLVPRELVEVNYIYPYFDLYVIGDFRLDEHVKIVKKIKDRAKLKLIGLTHYPNINLKIGGDKHYDGFHFCDSFFELIKNQNVQIVLPDARIQYNERLDLNRWLEKDMWI
ncbi:glycosyltransferase [Desulfonatronum parangueonense]